MPYFVVSLFSGQFQNADGELHCMHTLEVIKIRIEAEFFYSHATVQYIVLYISTRSDMRSGTLNHSVALDNRTAVKYIVLLMSTRSDTQSRRHRTVGQLLTTTLQLCILCCTSP